MREENWGGSDPGGWIGGRERFLALLLLAAAVACVDARAPPRLAPPTLLAPNVAKVENNPCCWFATNTYEYCCKTCWRAAWDRALFPSVWGLTKQISSPFSAEPADKE